LPFVPEYCENPVVTNASQVGNLSEGFGKDGKYWEGHHHVYCSAKFHVKTEFYCDVDGAFKPGRIDCKGGKHFEVGWMFPVKKYGYG
jgi:hypothetical protein